MRNHPRNWTHLIFLFQNLQANLYQKISYSLEDTWRLFCFVIQSLSDIWRLFLKRHLLLGLFSSSSEFCFCNYFLKRFLLNIDMNSPDFLLHSFDFLIFNVIL